MSPHGCGRRAGSSQYVIANGVRADGWAFGLAGAGLSAFTDAKLLLADADEATDPTLTTASTPCGAGPQTDVVLVGGTAVLTDRVRQQLDAVDGPPCPIRGAETLIAYARYDLGVSGTSTITTVDVETGATAELAAGTDPRWSPDRTRLAYSVIGDGIWTMAADGTDQRRIVLPDPEYAGGDSEPTWSPDGSRLAFARLRESPGEFGSVLCSDIWSVNADGTAARALRSEGQAIFSLDWSPDGASLLYALGGGNMSEV